MKKFFKKYEEIIIYIVFGVLATIVSWGSYAIFEKVFHLGVILSNTLSWTLAMVFAFFTNKLWVFKSKSFEKKLVLREFLTFASSRAVTGAIELLGVPLLEKAGLDRFVFTIVYALHLDKIGVLLTDGLYSKISLSIVIVILNYVFSKLIVFRKDKTERLDEKQDKSGS